MKTTRNIPLNAVRAFEAAARHASFSKAAEELGVTHGAVSKQIRQLENLIGKDLFHRTGRGVALTEHGSLLAQEVAGGLNMIAAAFEGYLGKARAPRTLRLTTVPSFAAAFLAPRLAKFTLSNPDIRLTIDTTARLVDFSRESFDAGIRFGPGKWPGIEALPISSGKLVPVCAPKVLAGIKDRPLETVVAGATLLHNLTPKEWRAWLEAEGAGSVDPAQEYIFEDTNVILQAAQEGQGLALLPKILVHGALKSGRLVSPFEHEIDGAFRHWLVAPPEKMKRDVVKTFAEWLAKEARKVDTL